MSSFEGLEKLAGIPRNVLIPALSVLSAIPVSGAIAYGGRKLTKKIYNKNLTPKDKRSAEKYDKTFKMLQEARKAGKTSEAQRLYKSLNKQQGKLPKASGGAIASMLGSTVGATVGGMGAGYGMYKLLNKVIK